MERDVNLLHVSNGLPIVIDESSILQQQPKVPSLHILFPQHILGPIPPCIRDPFRLYLAFVFLVKVPYTFDILVTFQTEWNVMDPGFEPLIVPFPEDC